MDEYVEKAAFREHLDSVPPFTKYGQRDPKYDFAKTVFLSELASYPAADVAPVRHGRWLSKEYMYGDPDVGVSDMWIDRIAEQSDYYAYCSECGKDAGYNNDGELILSSYCPNCGALMDKEDTNG